MIKLSITDRQAGWARTARGGRMTAARLVLASLWLLSCSVLAMAQTQPPPDANQRPNQCRIAPPYKINIEDCGRIIFTHKPLHPLVPSSIVPGSGPAIGAALEFQPNRNVWQIHSTTSAAVSYRRFWFVESKINFSHPALSESARAVSDDLKISLYARHQELPRMDFYGLGPDSRKQDLTVFSRRDSSVGVEVHNPLTGWLAVGAKIESRWPHVGSVKASGTRSIEQFFTEQQAPGFSKQPRFMRYGIFAKPHYPSSPPFKLDYNVGYSYYQDTDGGSFSFHRFEADVRHHIRFGRINNDPYATKEAARTPLSRRSNLELRARLSHSFTGANKQVPFYYQETLGGSDINGDPGLRAFDDYRFRDRNLLLFQGEYQFEIKSGYGVMVFYDVGKVAPTFSSLGSARLRHSYGVGFTVARGDRLYFRAYVGLGGGEGVHPFFGVPKFY